MALYATYFIHLMILPLFEEPQYFKIPYWIPCLIELLCLGFYTIRIIHLRFIQTRSEFFGDKKNLVIVFSLIVSLVCSVLKIK